MADELDDIRRKALLPTDAPQPFRRAGRAPQLTTPRLRQPEGLKIRTGAWELRSAALGSTSSLSCENDVCQLRAARAIAICWLNIYATISSVVCPWRWQTPIRAPAFWLARIQTFQVLEETGQTGLSRHIRCGLFFSDRRREGYGRAGQKRSFLGNRNKPKPVGWFRRSRYEAIFLHPRVHRGGRDRWFGRTSTND